MGLAWGWHGVGMGPQCWQQHQPPAARARAARESAARGDGEPKEAKGPPRSSPRCALRARRQLVLIWPVPVYPPPPNPNPKRPRAPPFVLISSEICVYVSVKNAMRCKQRSSSITYMVAVAVAVAEAEGGRHHQPSASPSVSASACIQSRT
jgi:hypothetical protein